MTIIVEDGSIVPNANSYVTVAEADAFFTQRGNTIWVDLGTDEVKEAALINATSYMQQKYRLLWKGSRADGFQSLDWPRRGVDVPDFFDPFFVQGHVPLAFRDTLFIPEDTIPKEVKECEFFLAEAAMGAGGDTLVSLQPNYGRKTKVEKVEGIQVEYMTSEEGGNTSMTNTYWDATKIIEPYLRPSAPQTGTVLRS